MTERKLILMRLWFSDWLPSHFLTEEDILMDFDISTPTTISSSGFNSDLGSPVDSVTETESDEDEFLAGLTHQLSRSSLLPDSANLNNNPSPKAWGLSDSPPVQEIKPGGEVAKVKKGTGYFDSSRGLGKQRSPVSPPKNPNFQGGGFSPKSQFPPLWNQDLMKQQRTTPPPLPLSAWPTVQRAAGSGMRAVFLGPPGSKRDSVGTGVFLPRNVNPTAPLKKGKKSGCATVLVPEKVVQALNNINTQTQSQPKFDSTKRVQVHNNGNHVARRNSNNVGASLEIQLPSEWTY